LLAEEAEAAQAQTLRVAAAVVLVAIGHHGTMKRQVAGALRSLQLHWLPLEHTP
tara:strand:+ start:9958 stop:10119 length:162 start_codon:yes stop_codon:yes gene_type:complete